MPDAPLTPEVVAATQDAHLLRKYIAALAAELSRVTVERDAAAARVMTAVDLTMQAFTTLERRDGELTRCRAEVRGLRAEVERLTGLLGEVSDRLLAVLRKPEV
jgi:hypothetical protein